MQKKWAVWLAAGALVGAGGIALALTVAGDDGPSDVATRRSSTTTTAATGRVQAFPEIPRTGDATEVLALLDRAREVTFHALWRAEAASAGFKDVSLEVWSKPPSGRRDITAVREGGGSIEAVTVLNGDGLTTCGRPAPDQPWKCTAGNPDEAGSDPLGAILDALTTTVRTGVVKPSSKTPPGDRPGRCFTITVGGKTQDACFTREGVPISIDSGGATLHLVDLSFNVPDDVLFPPSKPNPPQGPPAP